MDGNALLAATEDEAVKAEYQANTDEAMATGVFGAPAYVFDGELFWGQDRLQMLGGRLVVGQGPPADGGGALDEEARPAGSPGAEWLNGIDDALTVFGYGLFGYWPPERAPCPKTSPPFSPVTGPRVINLGR